MNTETFNENEAAYHCGDVFFSVGKYQYRTWIDEEEDNRKIFHECTLNGRRIKMSREFYNHSPYSYMSVAEFTRHIEGLDVWLQSKTKETV